MTNENEKDALTLSAEERESMKLAFREYLDANPVPSAPTVVRSPYFPHLVRMPAYAFVALLFLLTGTAYTAEASLPNDLLYPVKTGVIEPVFVKGTALTKHSRAKAESTLVERRLKEARKVVDRKELNPELASYFKAEIDEHTTAVHTYIAEASREGNTSEALEVSAELETTLEAHGDILESAGEASSPEDETVRDLVEDIEAEADEAENAGDRIESDSTLAPGEETQEFLEESQEEVQETLLKLRKVSVSFEDSENNELVEDAHDLLDDAEESYASSSDAIAAGDAKGAVENVRDSLRAVRQAVILLDSYEETQDDQ